MHLPTTRLQFTSYLPLSPWRSFQYLKDLREQNARIIIADMYQAAARAIMCEAYHQNMTAREVSAARQRCFDDL